MVHVIEDNQCILLLLILTSFTTKQKGRVVESKTKKYMFITHRKHRIPTVQAHKIFHSTIVISGDYIFLTARVTKGAKYIYSACAYFISIETMLFRKEVGASA